MWSDEEIMLHIIDHIRPLLCFFMEWFNLESVLCFIHIVFITIYVSTCISFLMCFFFNAGSFIILNIIQFYLKLSYPIEKLFLFPEGFELLTISIWRRHTNQLIHSALHIMYYQWNLLTYYLYISLLLQNYSFIIKFWTYTVKRIAEYPLRNKCIYRYSNANNAF